MYQFTEQSSSSSGGIRRLPSASAADPLGLNLRVSARLANGLLHCITSITPRARYYSFFPWAFEDYRESEHGTPKDRGRIPGVLARERAMVTENVDEVRIHPKCDQNPCLCAAWHDVMQLRARMESVHY